MKLLNILQSQVVRTFTEIENETGASDEFTVVRAIEQKYRFLEAPRTVEQFDIAKGVTFRAGRFEDIVIEELTIFGNGAICTARGVATTRIDSFLDELAMWVGETVTQNPDRIFNGPRAYTSLLEVEAGFQLDERFAQFKKIGDFLTQSVNAYGFRSPAYGVSSFAMTGDFLSFPRPHAGPFGFERRAGQPYDANQYFSTAPLTTEDHLNVLGMLSEAFA